MRVELCQRHNRCMATHDDTPMRQPDLAKIAALIGDPARAAMLSALLGNVSLPATDLAHAARVTPQTTSTHLRKLLDAGLVTAVRHGRHKYFRLANAQVAQVLEALAVIAPARPVRALSESLSNRALRKARTCYSHLAGELGVGVAHACFSRGFLVDHGDVYQLTPGGADWFNAHLDLRLSAEQGRLRFARPCLDWSERVPHLGGALGIAITDALFAHGWIARTGDTRAVRVTAAGERGFFGPLRAG
jgi:DNA-binding transcriptional ArsR family regulator